MNIPLEGCPNQEDFQLKQEITTTPTLETIAMIEETSKDSNCSMNRSSKKALIMLMSGKSHKLDRRKEACVVRAAMGTMILKVFSE